MATKSVQTLLDDIRSLSEQRYAIVREVLSLVKSSFKTYAEEVKYGGILFSGDGVQFGGVFAYTAHVSVEFGQGASIDDPFGFLEGAGKGRRHIKLHSAADIQSKKLAKYLVLAHRAARGVN
jgi:hypothetical protein